jgi:speckle-type POZ protein
LVSRLNLVCHYISIRINIVFYVIASFVKHANMPSDLSGTPKMTVPYEWNFESVGEEPMTIASKMILFRGEKVFRVGLKNHTLNPVLFFMAIDLGKIGMKVENVLCGFKGSGLGPATMIELKKEDIGDDGSLQLFIKKFPKKLVGKRTFVFRIGIVGADSHYSYQLSDRLAKDQLWAALKNQQNLADVEFVVKDKTFPAHKAILAARSPVFAAEFEKKQPGKDVPQQIRIETGAEPSTVLNFLHFMYTGEPIGTCADEELLKLADHYQLKILSGLCKVALKKMDSMQMAKVSQQLNSNAEDLSSSKIM